jgi:hypothetical protein
MEVGLIEYEEKDRDGARITISSWKPEKSKEMTARQKAYFAEFWKAYPRKESKQLAEKSFRRISPDRNKLNEMLKAIEEQKQSRQWREEAGKYIPHPSTWLNRGNWQNETDGSVPITAETRKIPGMANADEFFGKG